MAVELLDATGLGKLLLGGDRSNTIMTNLSA